ncbi:hypothetical protein BD414DRAFT_122491 [Trametes punicea]|nr:hypothetical protein BD414DRAFT_122491 [Trametes punicea]
MTASPPRQHPHLSSFPPGPTPTTDIDSPNATALTLKNPGPNSIAAYRVLSDGKTSSRPSAKHGQSAITTGNGGERRAQQRAASKHKKEKTVRKQTNLTRERLSEPPCNRHRAQRAPSKHAE